MASSVIGQAVKETRRQANMTVAQLAELVPADDRTIFRYESNGRIKPDILARLAQVLKSKDLADKYCSECPVSKTRLRLKREGPTLGRTIVKLLKSIIPYSIS